MDDLRHGSAIRHSHAVRHYIRHAVLVVATLAIGIRRGDSDVQRAECGPVAPAAASRSGPVDRTWDGPAVRTADAPPDGPAGIRDFQKTTRMMSDVGGYEFHGADEWTMRDGESASVVYGTRVTGNFFASWESRHAWTRASPRDDVVGASPVLVISNSFWHRHFGADRRIIGRPMQNALYGVTYTIVGVMLRGIWLSERRGSLGAFATFIPPSGGDNLRYLNVFPVGRLAAGATEQQAQSEFTRFCDMRSIRRGMPARAPRHGPYPRSCWPTPVR